MWRAGSPQQPICCENNDNLAFAKLLEECARDGPEAPNVASGLARVGLRSSPSKAIEISLKKLSARFWGCCAPQRGQARSPQQPICHENNDNPAFARLLEECARGGPEAPIVASGLARVGLQSSPSKATEISLKKLGARFWGCCATQRGQARSPQ